MKNHWKINLEPLNGDLVQMIVLIFRFCVSVQTCIVEPLDTWIEDVVMNLIVNDGVEEVCFGKVLYFWVSFPKKKFFGLVDVSFQMNLQQSQSYVQPS